MKITILPSADELPLSIAPELESLEVSQEEREVLDGRWEKFLEDPGSAVTLAEFQKRMNTRPVAR